MKTMGEHGIFYLVQLNDVRCYVKISTVANGADPDEGNLIETLMVF